MPAVADLSLLPRLWDPGEEAERFFEIGFFRDEKLLDAASFDDETLSCRPSTALIYKFGLREKTVIESRTIVCTISEMN